MFQGRLLAFLLSVILVIIISISYAPPGYAQDLPQLPDTQILEGFKIYFSEAALEASRFDRSEAGISRIAGLLQQQGATLHTLEWRTQLPQDADLIIIAGPVGDILPDQVARLWAYFVNSNGRLLLLTDPPVGDALYTLRSFNGLVTLMWNDMGFRPLDNLVVTEGEMQMVEVTDPAPVDEGDEEESTSESAETTLVEAPILVTDLVVSALDSNHPITAELQDELAYFGARSFEVDLSMPTSQVTPLALSDPIYYGEFGLDEYSEDGLAEYNESEDTARGVQILAVAYEQEPDGLKVVVIGDREFATNGGGLQTSLNGGSAFEHPGNVQFLLNSVYWLLDVEAGDISSDQTTGEESPDTTAEPTTEP